jgi:hypothetical protein
MKQLFTLAALCVAATPFMLAGDTGSSGGTAALNTFGLPPWQCHKTVWAGQITGIIGEPGVDEKPHTVVVAAPDGTTASVAIRVGQEWFAKHEPEVGGYFVLYENGYQSYSPADAFEDGYTPAGGDHPGELAWNAYSAALNGRDAVSGKIMASWASLLASGDEEVQAVCRAWNRAARAVEAQTIARLASANATNGAAAPSSFRDRVRTEHAELSDKGRKLFGFTESATFKTLPEAEQGRLTRQLEVMREYASILEDRINAFDDAPQQHDDPNRTGPAPSAEKQAKQMAGSEETAGASGQPQPEAKQ